MHDKLIGKRTLDVVCIGTEHTHKEDEDDELMRFLMYVYIIFSNLSHQNADICWIRTGVPIGRATQRGVAAPLR